MEKVNETKSCFFEKINRIEKLSAKITNKKAVMTQIKSEMKEETLQLI